MRKYITKTLIILIFTLMLSACSFSFNVHTHTWGNYYDNGDGTHTRTCLYDIEHTETEPHVFGDATVLKEATNLTCGKEKYVCNKCGYTYVKTTLPLGEHVFDQEVIDSKYLYKSSSDYSGIYYKSCVCGACGDETTLFEYSAISNDYTLTDYIKFNGEGYIDLESNKNECYIMYQNESENTSRLPSTYDELEYIEATGTQWIDTNVLPKDTLKIITKFEFTSITYPNAVYGTSNDYSQTIFLDSNYVLHIRPNDATKDFQYSSCSVNKEYIVESTLDKTTINGKSVTLKSRTTNPGNGTILLFKRINNQYGKVKLFSMKIYDNNTLIHDYIPAKVKSNNKVGVYDAVDNEFLESSGANLIAGNLIQNESYSILPHGYTQVEYIESTGTQYIDTGIISDNTKNYNTDIKLSYSTVEPENQIFGFGGNEGDGIGTNLNTFWECENHSLSSNTIYELSWSRSNDQYSRTINNTTYSGSTNALFSENTTLKLFACNTSYENDTVNYYCYCKLYECSIYVDDELVRNYIPSINNSTNQIGLYDTVTDTFYINQGTGEFIAGNVLYNNNNKYTKTNYTELEYIESDGKAFIDTGWYVDFDKGFEIEAIVNLLDITSDKKRCAVLSNYDSTSTLSLEIYSNTSRLYLQNENVDNRISGIYVYNKNTINVKYINGVWKNSLNNVSNSGNTILTGKANKTARIFTDQYDGGRFNVFNVSMRLYSLKIYEDNKLIRDYIPIITKTGEIGLLDKVSNIFYSSESNTNFIAGPQLNVNYNSLLSNSYKVLDYIETTGTQYINTGVTVDNSIKISIDSEAIGTESWLFGARSTIGATDTFGLFITNDQKWFAQIGGNKDSNGGHKETENIYNRVTHTIDGSSWNFDDNIYSIQNTLTTNNIPLCLFAMNQGGSTIDKRYYSGKLYSCKIWKNGSLVRDYIPALSPSGEAGLYDKVNNVFYTNDGTGEFLYGRVISYINNQDSSVYYEELEYIESTGNEYIDTLYNPNGKNVTLEIDAQVVSNEKMLQFLAGAMDDSRFHIGIYSGDNGWHPGIGESYGFLGNSDTNRHILSINTTGEFYIDNNLMWTSNKLKDINSNIYLFDGNWNGSPTTIYSSIMRLYSCKIYESGELVRDFIPVKINNGEVGLYDKINKDFYLNNGSGGFNVGPIINTVYQNTTNKLVDYYLSSYELPNGYTRVDSIESTGSQYIDTLISFDPEKTFKVINEITYTNTSAKQINGFNDNIGLFFGVDENKKIMSNNKLYSQSNTVYAYSMEIKNGIMKYNFLDKDYEIPVILSSSNISSYLLFAALNSSTNQVDYFNYMRLYSSKIYVDDVLVRHFIPCIKDDTYTPGLYDLVTNTFFVSNTNTDFKYSEDGLGTINKNNLNLGFNLYNNSYSFVNSYVSNIYLLNNFNILKKNFVTVIRNSDGVCGFLDIIDNKFYTANNINALSYGNIIDHFYNDGIITREATYDTNGIKEKTCSLCSNKIYEVIDKTSYKVIFNVDNDIRIKEYNNDITNDFIYSNIIYTRNLYSYNYSKIDNYIIFEVESNCEYKLFIKNGEIEILSENKYKVFNISKDTIINVKKVSEE